MPKQNVDIADSVLTAQEKAALAIFADNKIMFNAVQKMVLASVYYNGTLRTDLTPDPSRNAALALATNAMANLTNEALGQDIRALAEGVRIVELGFIKLEKYKSAPKPEKPAAKTGR